MAAWHLGFFQRLTHTHYEGHLDVNPDVAKLFILGCHRSGTTMLQQALNRHSMIAIPPETKFFSAFLGHSRRCQKRRLCKINRDLQINLQPPRQAIQEQCNAREFFEQIARAYLTRLNRPDVVYFGEKTPVHCGYVPQIKRLFPRSKFLWIFRDGRDVALSLRSVPWLNRTLPVNFLIWLFYHAKQMRAAQDKSLDILFLKYEDVVSQPLKEFGRIAQFLKVPFEPAVVFGHGNREGVLDWEYPWKKLALDPITSSRIGLWRKEMSGTEVEFLEWLGGRALMRLNYPLASTNPKWSNLLGCPKMLLDLGSLVCRVPVDEMANQFFSRPICFG